MQARKQTNKQANKLHVRRCCEGGGTKTWTKTRGDQNRDQNKGGNNRGLFEQGESWISVFFQEKNYCGISPKGEILKKNIGKKLILEVIQSVARSEEKKILKFFSQI